MKATNGNLVVTDVSFSSYLKPPDQEASSQEHPTRADTELGIFDARKYFNEGVTVNNDQSALSCSKRMSPIKDGILHHPSDPSLFPRFSSASSIDGYGLSYRNRSLASSEASWNSHTGLLGPSSDPQRGEKKRGGRSWWLLFHSKCPCSGKNSVRVKENPNNSMKKEAGENPNREKTMPADQRNHFRVSLNMENRRVLVSAPPKKPLIDAALVTVTATSGFTFPILNATNPSVSSSSSSPMKSLDDHKIGANLTVLDDGAESKEINGGPTSTVDVDQDDAASDASSDLFEIESITTQSTYPITSHHHLHRDSLNEAMPQLLPLPSGNHHSEASNVPRITTIVAEGSIFGRKIGTDYPSLLSAPEFERFSRIDSGRSARVMIGGGECDGDRRPRGNGLLSCRTGVDLFFNRKRPSLILSKK